ncbi:MAG: hypothetical protein J2P24_16690, partial [Streptosporangiales bacterium]|nr:hypothetical protein [Streptosporangiales bacterium]
MARTEKVSGPRAAVAPRGPDPTVTTDRAGQWLARLSVVPAAGAAGLLVTGFLLVLAGAFRPVLVLPLGGVAAVALGWCVWRSARGVRLRPDDGARTPTWVVWSTVAVAAVFGVLVGVTHSEQIFVERDPASYVQFGWWLGRHGSLPVAESRWAFGGGVPGMSWNSPAFYQVGPVVWPQFMIGLPMLLAVAKWTAGLGGMLVLNAVLGSLALLAFGGLTARLVGPRIAPFATLLLAFSFPQLFVARSAYSEPLAELLVLAGLCLLLDCRTVRARGAVWVLAGASGLLLGIGELVRVDVLKDLVPAIALAGVFAARRRRYALPFTLFLSAGLAVGAVDGWVLSRPYVTSLSDSVVPLGVIAAAVAVVAAAYALLGRFGRLGPLAPDRIARWRVGRLPVATACGVLVLAAFVAFATRPAWQTVRGATGSTAHYIGYMQGRLGLPHDPGRFYYEYALHWVAWWLGWPAVALAAVAAAVLTARVLGGRAPRWVPVLPILLWTTATTLYLPGITPDHPWADRRLVPTVLPTMVLLACWGLRWLVGLLRSAPGRDGRPWRLAGRLPRRSPRALAVAGVLALLVPLGVATGPL